MELAGQFYKSKGNLKERLNVDYLNQFRLKFYFVKGKDIQKLRNALWNERRSRKSSLDGQKRDPASTIEDLANQLFVQQPDFTHPFCNMDDSFVQFLNSFDSEQYHNVSRTPASFIAKVLSGGVSSKHEFEKLAGIENDDDVDGERGDKKTPLQKSDCLFHKFGNDDKR
jgi:hypothetical protein